MTAPKHLRGMPPSAREMQLVQLVARGMTAPRIAIVGVAIRRGHLQVPVTGTPPAGFDEGLFDVLVRIARGMTNQEIGAELHLSTDSVKSRVRRLFVVLGVYSREEAIVAGLACGALRLVPVRRLERVAA